MKNKFDDDEDDIPELSSLDEILDFGLRPGSSNSSTPKKPGGGAPGFKAGTLEEMMEQDDAEMEEELMKAMREFEEDPITATRKQLVRMATIEWRHLQKLYKEFNKSGTKPDRNKTLRFDIDSSTTNLLKLQTSLKALPVQRKDEMVADNVATMSMLLEQYRKENHGTTDEIKTLLEAQRERIRKEETGQ